MSLKKRNVLLYSVIGIALVGGGIAIKLNPNNNSTNYTEEKLRTQDLKTYYNFSGDVKAVNSKAITLSNESTIEEIVVKEGTMVKEGDTIFSLSGGSKITASMDGMLTDVLVNEGMKYTSDTHIATIVDTDALQVEIKVNEYDINNVEIGDEVKVYINALNKTVDGKLINLSKNANVMNGISYFRGVVEIEDTEDILVGMTVEVKVVKDDIEDAKTVSINAVKFDEDNQAYVYIKDANGNKVKKNIIIGVNDGSVVEVKSGINSNDTVISSNENEMFNPIEMMHGGK